MDLSEVPSPYVTGLFDSIVEMNSEEMILNGIIETDRGCPFKRTFCDWGSLTFNKVRKFHVGKIKADRAQTSPSPACQSGASTQKLGNCHRSVSA